MSSFDWLVRSRRRFVWFLAVFECGRVFVGFFIPSSRVLVLFTKRKKFLLGERLGFPPCVFFR